MPTAAIARGTNAATSNAHQYAVFIDGLDVAKQPGTPGSLFGTDIDSVVVHEIFGAPTTMDFVVDDPLRVLSLRQGANVYAVDHRGVLLSTGVWRSDDLFLGTIQTARRDPESLTQRWLVRAISLDGFMDDRILTSGVIPAGISLQAALQLLFGSFDPRVSALANDAKALGASDSTGLGFPNLIQGDGNFMLVAVPLAGKTYREAAAAIIAGSDLYAAFAPGSIIDDPEDAILDIDLQGRVRFIANRNYVPFGGPASTALTIKQGTGGTFRAVVPSDIENSLDKGRLVTAVYVRGVDEVSSRWVVNQAYVDLYGRIEAFLEAPEVTTAAAALAAGFQYLVDHQPTQGIGMLLSGTHDQLHPQGTTTPEWGGWHARSSAYAETADGYWAAAINGSFIFPVWEVTKRFQGGGVHMSVELQLGNRAPSAGGALRSAGAVLSDTTRAAGRLVGTLDEVAVRSKAGIPSDADFDVPRDGFMVVDTTNKIVWVRMGGGWVPTTGASARVANSAVQSIPNNADTALTFDTVTSDPLSWFDGTSKLTPGAGKYLAGGGCAFVGSAVGIRRLRLRLNGATTRRLVQKETDVETAGVQMIATELELGPTDYVEFVALQNSGGALNTSVGDGAPDFWLVRI